MVQRTVLGTGLSLDGGRKRIRSVQQSGVAIHEFTLKFAVLNSSRDRLGLRFGSRQYDPSSLLVRHEAGATSESGVQQRPFMRNRILRIVGFLLALGVVGAVLTYVFFKGERYTFSFTETQIRDKLDEKFPIEKSYLALFSVRYENPRVDLVDGSREIHVGADAMVDVVINDVELSGSTDIVTEVGYDSQEGQFYLYDPQMTTLQVSPLSEKFKKYEKKVMDIGNEMVREYFDRVPIYKLRRNDVRTAAARLLLKEVKVEGEVLYVTLGL